MNIGQYYLRMKEIDVDDWAKEQAEMIYKQDKEKNKIEIKYNNRKHSLAYPVDNLVWFWHRKL